MTDKLTSWALPRLANLLPLDEESLQQIISYSTSLSKDAGAEHLKNLLGDSPQALEFISSFNSRRADVPGPRNVSSVPAAMPVTTAPNANQAKPRSKKAKAPLHSAGPARQPENYGNLIGGYVKSRAEQDYIAGPGSRGGGGHARNQSHSNSNAFSLTQEPAALQSPNVTSGGLSSSNSSSRNPSPSPSKQKLPPSAREGSLISDYLPNVKAKQSKKPAHSGTSTPSKGSASTTTTSSISDLTAAIAALELSTNPTSSTTPRKCTCNTTIHPLFAPAPNCLSCGKIICALEGLQPCSFCGSPILSSEQVNTMIRALKEERGNEKMSLHNASIHHGTGSGGPGTPTTRSADNSGDEAVNRARAHRDKLLAFQSQNAQRTKVHDEAADFDDPAGKGAGMQWMSPAQRALALKKQQKYMREMEESNKPEWEKKKTVMSLDIKGGKVVRSFQNVRRDMAKDEQEAEEEQEEAAGDAEGASEGGQGRRGAFGRNPLLAGGGLVRPIWKAPDDGGKGKGREENEVRKPTWRRVQDDNDEDNEQWILDGGVYGHETIGDP